MHQPENEGATLPTGRKRFAFRLAAVLLSLLALVLVDVGLRVFRLMPPEDPALFHVRTHMEGFSPFLEEAGDVLTIKPDWVKRDEIYQFKDGSRAGRTFLYPGFRPCRFTRHKAPGTIRLFALGGSTTFGQWVGQDEAFTNLIGERLHELVPDRPVEAINLGCPGVESTRVLILLETVLELEPDLVLVYCGNNELLMRSDVMSSARSRASGLRVSLLRISSIAAWINYAVSDYRSTREYKLISEEAAALEAGQLLTQFPRPTNGRIPLIPESYREEVAEEYGANIRSMALLAKKRGVPIVFLLPSVNLLKAPEQSAHREGFEDEATFEGYLAECAAAMQRGEPEEALRLANLAVELSPEHAMAHFVRAGVLLDLGRKEDAEADLQKAVDLNVYAHRMTSLLQAAMIAAVESTGAPWVDTRPLTRGDLTAATAKKLFVDHCHPTKLGHRLIADATFPVVVDALRASGTLPAAGEGSKE